MLENQYENVSIGDFVVRTYENLKGNRVNWDAHWKECADYVIPQKNDVWGEFTNGEKKSNKIFDSTGPHANELLASALHGMLTNPMTKWFGLSSGNDLVDKNDSVRKYFQDVVNILHNIMNDSNFQTEVHEFYLDLCCFGTSVMVVEEDDTDVVRFQSRPIYQCYVMEAPNGSIDSIFRRYEMTYKQIVQQFGKDTFTESEHFACSKDQTKKFEIIHGVFPKGDYNPFSLGLKGSRKFHSVHVLRDTRKVLKEHGFFEFPYIVSRWTKLTHEIYGRSPSMKALPDIKMINEVMKTTIRSAQKVVDPPLQAPDDGMVLPLRTAPASINYYRAGTSDRIEPLLTGSRVDFGLQFLENLQTKINKSYFIDQLQLGVDGPQMTATEVMQRTEERLRLLGPVLGRQHNEFLKPLVERVFNIAQRRNLLPTPPEVISEKALKVQYSSMIARAQRASEADNINRVMGLVGPFFQINPDMADNINFDEMFRYTAGLYNLPQEIIVEKDQLDETRQAKLEAMQQQMQQQEQMQTAETINKLK